jgi:hypothetical protein
LVLLRKFLALFWIKQEPVRVFAIGHIHLAWLQSFRSRSHDAVIRVYDEAGNLLETQEHAGELKEW